MPVFKNFADLEILRGIKAFLRIEVGITRGALPPADVDSMRAQLTERDEKIQQMQRWLKGKDKRLGHLRRETKELSASRGGAAAVPIFFILGRQKSGTTWLMRLLNRHPEILCRGEGKFFGRNAATCE